jgi:hypothetical protein
LPALYVVVGNLEGRQILHGQLLKLFPCDVVEPAELPV